MTLAVVAMFEGKSGGRPDLTFPFFKEYNWIRETGWSWQDVERCPAPVWDWFQYYRNIEIPVRNRRTAT